MSLWVIDDYATIELLANFYTAWTKDPAGGRQKAFREAQLKMKERYGNPYYWGAFVMMGEE